MKKRIIASMLTLILCMSLLPSEVFADKQSPIKGISNNSLVGHIIERGKTIPDVRLMFQEPDPSGIVDGSGAENGGADHGPETFYYQVEMIDQATNASLKSPEVPKKLGAIIGEGTAIKDGIPVKGIENGRLYKMSIIPNHYHTYKDSEGNTSQKFAPATGFPHPYKYVLTDFDTQIEGKGGTLEVTWEDTGYKDIDYTIGYIQGNYEEQSLSQINESTGGNKINYISWTDIDRDKETYTDPQTGRQRFRYTIEEGIATGQMYSAFVVSNTEKIGDEMILKNKDTPKIVTATTEIGLSVHNAGKGKIRLEWDSQFIHIADGAYELTKTQIKEISMGQESGRVIATLYGKPGADIGYYEYREPKVSTYYQLVFIYELKSGQQLKPEPKTAKVLYVPGELRTKPTTPVIPQPIGKNTITEGVKKEDFLVPGDVLQGVPIGDYWKNDHTFHVNMIKPPTLNLVWSAYKEDLSLLYDIVVTDDIGVASLEVDPIIKDLSFSSGQNRADVLKSNEKIVGFKHTIGEYYNSEMKRLPIVPNKVYYIKITAKRKYGDDFEPSLPAMATIMFDSDGEVFAPPTLSKPPLRIDPEGIEATSITLGWLEGWYEIMAKYPGDYPVEEVEKAKEWNSKVYTGTSTGPAISFVNTGELREHELKNDRQLELVKGIVNKENSREYGDNYIDRVVNLGKNVQYDYKFMPYTEILKGLEAYNATTVNKIEIEEYIQMLMKAETDPSQNYGWNKITAKSVEDDDSTQWKLYEQKGLKPNTSYVFFVKPYTLDYDGSKLQASLPTWVVGTTLPDGEMEEATPTVPVLSLHGRGDTQLSVKWTYKSEFDYEIVYSRLEDPDKATVWPFEISGEIGDPNYVEHGAQAVVTIDGLFPDTTYNIWIRAKQKKGTKVSAWSNPVTKNTLLLGAPTAPAGLGIAGYQSILELGKDFKPVDSNHITVEWERNGPDKDLDDLTQDSQRVQKEYRYAIEIADNPEFIDRQQIMVGKDTVGNAEDNAEVLSRSMVYFGELIANRPYYVRAKTILIASDQENNRQIIMESDYTRFVRIITKPSQGEYDGGDKVNEVIYPNKIEETYDGKTWVYEILDTQKAINELVTEGQFRYIVPVQKYRDRYDAQYRVIRIPQPLVTSLIRRGMELEIRTKILSIQIPAKALESAMVGTRADGMVEFKFETLRASDLYGISMGYEFGFLSIPERMSITIKDKKGIRSLDKVEALMKIKINMPYQYDYMVRNLGGYTYDALEGRWKQGNHQFDKINMRLEYTSGQIGTYAVYEKTRVPTKTDTMSYAMSNVARKHDIVGLGSKYTPNMSVGVSQYINMILGIAENRAQIMPGAVTTNAEKNRARNAGIYTGTGQSLTQEAAISGLVRLYELRQGLSVDMGTRVNVGQVTPAYRNNIQKAYSLGLISSIRPKQPITYEELFDLLDQIID